MQQPITFLVWADNTPGVLIRLASLFSRRKINIDSLTVSETEIHSVSRFTIVITVSPVLAATIGRQIERMIEVRRVIVNTDESVFHREVALMRVDLSASEELDLQERYAGLRVVERNENGLLLECAATESVISTLVSELRARGLREFVRSGRIAVTARGDYADDLTRSLHELRPEASEGSCIRNRNRLGIPVRDHI